MTRIQALGRQGCRAAAAMARTAVLALAVPGLATLASLPVNAQGQPQASADGETLQHFSEPSESGGISYNIGDRFNGPGVLTIGRLGTKKHLVLPAGEWVALAATDYRTAGGTDMTALAFGSFSGRQLRSLLRVNFNRNVTAAANWSDFGLCAQEDSHALLRIGTLPSAMQSECVLVKAYGSIHLAHGHAGNELVRNLARLGAEATGPAIGSTVMLAEKRWGFMNIFRADFLQPGFGNQAGRASDWWPAALEAAPARAAQAKALLAWVQRYRAAAHAGLRRGFDEDDLAAGAPAQRRPGLNDLGDVSPAPDAGIAAR